MARIALMIFVLIGANCVSTTMMPSLPDEDGRVAAGADEHVDVVAHLDGVDLNVVEVLILLRDGRSPTASAAPATMAAATDRLRSLCGTTVLHHG